MPMRVRRSMIPVMVAFLAALSASALADVAFSTRSIVVRGEPQAAVGRLSVRSVCRGLPAPPVPISPQGWATVPLHRECPAWSLQFGQVVLRPGGRTVFETLFESLAPPGGDEGAPVIELPPLTLLHMRVVDRTGKPLVRGFASFWPTDGAHGDEGSLRAPRMLSLVPEDAGVVLLPGRYRLTISGQTIESMEGSQLAVDDQVVDIFHGFAELTVRVESTAELIRLEFLDETGGKLPPIVIDELDSSGRIRCLYCGTCTPPMPCI